MMMRYSNLRLLMFWGRTEKAPSFSLYAGQYGRSWGIKMRPRSHGDYGVSGSIFGRLFALKLKVLR